jgi:hypothetical protein
MHVSSSIHAACPTHLILDLITLNNVQWSIQSLLPLLPSNVQIWSTLCSSDLHWDEEILHWTICWQDHINVILRYVRHYFVIQHGRRDNCELYLLLQLNWVPFWSLSSSPNVRDCFLMEFSFSMITFTITMLRQWFWHDWRYGICHTTSSLFTNYCLKLFPNVQPPKEALKRTAFHCDGMHKLVTQWKSYLTEKTFS